MNIDKNLRDIWSNADKEYIDAMKENGSVLQNPQETQRISFNDWCDAQERNSGMVLESVMKNCSSQQIPNRLELKENVSNHPIEIKNVNSTLWSIWAPTVKDDLIKNEDSHHTFKLGKQDPLDSKSLIRKETNDSYECISSSDSESELSNNWGSQESQDELNEETFGKFAAVPDEFRPNESYLSDLSEATLLWDSQLKSNSGKVVTNNNQQPISNLPKSDNSKIQNSSKKEITLPPFPESKIIRKSVGHRKNIANSNKFMKKSKNFDLKYRANFNTVEKEVFMSQKQGLSSTKSCHVNSSNHILEYEIINPIPKKTQSVRRPNRVKKCSSNPQKYPRKPPKVNFKETLEIETREIIDRDGNSQRLTKQKITYVEGRMIDEFSKSQNTKCDKIKWVSNINLPAIENQSRNIRNNNLGDDNSTGNDIGYHRRISVGDYPSLSHANAEHANIQYENPVKNNGGARHKNFNAYKRYNSYTNTDMKTDKNFVDHKEHSNWDMNSFRRPNIKFNEGLFNQDKIHGSNHVENFKTDSLGKDINGLIRGKFCAKEFENRLSWNIIESESDEEQNTSKSHSTKVKIPNNSDENDYLLNNYDVQEKDDNKTTSIKYKDLISKFENVHTNPKVKELQNKNLHSANGETNKFQSSENNKSSSSEVKKQCERKKSRLITYAKDIADLIVGCQTAHSVLKSQYDEWEINRNRSINILEQIVGIINHSSNRGKTIKNIIAAINVAVAVGDAVCPNKALSVGMRVITAVVGAFANFAGKGVNKKDLETKEFEIKELFQQDIDASSSVYIYGIQCDTQFQETCSLIREFHQSIQSENFISVTDDEDVKEFLSEISEYNPLNLTVFYKRLKLGYQKLKLSSKSKDCKAFCRVFEDIPEAINVINLLPYRFNPDGFDHTIVHPYWEEIFSFLYDKESTDIDIFLRKVQECIFFLKKEHALLKRCVSILFKEENAENETSM